MFSKSNLTKNSTGLSCILATFTKLGQRLVSLLSVPVAAFPVFPYHLFNWSILTGLVVMVISAWISGCFLKEFSFPRKGWLDDLTAYADPLLVQVLWTAVISFVSSLMAWAAREKGSVHLGAIFRTAITGVMPIGILIVGFIVGDMFFKPSLGYDRPSAPLPETGLTALFREGLNRRESGDAAPSGFLLRQLALFFSMWLMLKQPLFQARPRWIRSLLHLANLLVLVFIAFSRLYRRAHSPFDLSLSIGVGIVVVWTLIVFIYRASSRQYQYAFFTTAASNLALVGCLFYYAQTPNLLLRNSGYMLALFGVYYLLIEWFGENDPPGHNV